MKTYPRKPEHWAELALCAEVSGDLFYPEKGEFADQAKAICRSCEVRLPCLADALEHGDRNGIFGGFTERPRLKIARDHKAGKPLEDIIAEDDAAYYAWLEGAAERAEAAAERKRVLERAKSAAVRAELSELEIAS